MLTVYIDDSGTDPKQQVAIATALIIPASQIIRMEQEWDRFKEKEQFSVFHTSEFVARNPRSEFADWREDKQKRVFARVRQISMKYGVRASGIHAYCHSVDCTSFEPRTLGALEKYPGFLPGRTCADIGPSAIPVWRTKSEYATLASLWPFACCRVTIADLEGVAHTVEVTASSLYEAIALGLVALRGNKWVMGIPDGFAPVKVRVADIPVEHEVKMKDFTQWLDRRGNSPRYVMDRKKIRDILGLSRSV